VDDALTGDASARVSKTMDVMIQLTQLLAGRTYRSTWEL
jgi:hypothetical protein